jgi:hypothetical protein
MGELQVSMVALSTAIGCVKEQQIALKAMVVTLQEQQAVTSAGLHAFQEHLNLSGNHTCFIQLIQ